MNVKQSVEWELAGETEILGGNLLQRSHMFWLGLEPGSPRWEAGE
jgi:hypothetical protein